MRAKVICCRADECSGYCAHKESHEVRYYYEDVACCTTWEECSQIEEKVRCTKVKPPSDDTDGVVD